MKDLLKLTLYILLLSISSLGYTQNKVNEPKPEQTIFVWGGDIDLKFTQYIVDLTHKPNPKICFVPTASADNEDNIKLWKYFCESLSIEPHVLKVWVSSQHDTIPFEKTLLSMDAIVVGGGNTLNMMGIWKVQNIDQIMRKALEKGIILAGGSAGSICWFKQGISDSRPAHLSSVEGLGFLPYNNCPHFDEADRKDLFIREINDSKIKINYACDEFSGILFKNGKVIETVSKNDINHSYLLTLKKNAPVIEKMKSTILIDKNAISESNYETIVVEKKIKDLPKTNKWDTPKDAFISQKYSGLKPENEERILNTQIEKIFIYNDTVAAVVSKIADKFYGVWYFFKKNNAWNNAGEDIGGQSVLESEISFRERVLMHYNRLIKE